MCKPDDERISNISFDGWNRKTLNAYWMVVLISVIAELIGACIVWSSKSRPLTDYLLYTMLLPTVVSSSTVLVAEWVNKRLAGWSSYWLVGTATLLAFEFISIQPKVTGSQMALLMPMFVAVFYFEWRKVLFSYMLGLLALFLLYTFNEKFALHADWREIMSTATIMTCGLILANGVMSRGAEIQQYLLRTLQSQQDLLVSMEDQVRDRTQTLEQSMRETAAALADVSIYEERSRIASEIHDIVGHTLTSTIWQIEAGKYLLASGKEGAAEKLEISQELVRQGLNEIRRSVHMLREGGPLFDLTVAAGKLIRDTEKHTGVTVHDSISPMPELTASVKKVLYYALQEGLTNGIRHGHCTTFTFSLGCQEDKIVFKLGNNGQGGGPIRYGFGLTGMKERVEALQGNLHIESQPEGGYLLQIHIPFERQLGES